MKGGKSWTRQMYECHYRYMRHGISVEYMQQYLTDPMDTMKAADYSYQAYGYEPSGWVSDLRRKRFHAIKYRITSSGEYLPF